ncbi:DUF2156 domain-containing protein [Candidatus Daviesbacteria bacterium]|nr:DUF2156 domain-containing protein [Candidatus Daviesbacteria bacterium]
MIPVFPKFIKLSFEHKPHVEKHVLKHPPYSDFNFTSLISWGGEETYLSELNSNLVIRLRDYLTNEPFYTFIGINLVNQTIKTLLYESKKNGLHPKLKLIPEAVLKADPQILHQFEIQEDRDNFDYIYLLEEAKDFKGNQHRDKRNFINRFKRLYQSSHQLLDIANPQIRTEMLNLFYHWQKLKDRTDKEVENELFAIKKVLQLGKRLNLICIGIYIEKKLVAFSINEILTDGYTMNLFEKADTNYQGIFPYLRSITARYLIDLDGQLLSHEQDLGIEGLRKSKMSYGPKFFLKKYTISHKTSSA